MPEEPLLYPKSGDEVISLVVLRNSDCGLSCEAESTAKMANFRHVRNTFFVAGSLQ